MDLSATFAGDWVVVDDEETVQLLPRAGAASSFGIPLTVPNAWRTSVDRDEQARPPGLLGEQRNLAWHLWLSQIPGAVRPKPGDVIKDQDGVRWTVKAVKDCDEGQRFRCLSIKER